MAECNHVFVGKADGVHCIKCNLHLSAAEYEQGLKPSGEKPKRQTKKKEVKTDE